MLKSKPKAHRARKALVSNIAGNEETFDLSVASGIVKPKASDETVPVASEPNIKKKTLRSRRALVESFRAGNETTLELSVANPIGQKPNEGLCFRYLFIKLVLTDISPLSPGY
nr:expressed protein [Hymenolepis microstoma]